MWRVCWETYAGDGLGHLAHDCHVESRNLGVTHLLGVVVEPEVVCAVAPQVGLVTAQVKVPHPFFFAY